MLVFFVVLFFCSSSYSFLDFVGEQAKKAVELAAYVDAAAELSSEVAPDKDLEDGAKDIQKRAEILRSESSHARYLSRSTQSVLKGPDWSSKRLETNIKATTQYIRRLKSLLARAAALGTEGAIALNTTETNVALNEVQKNQQTMIMQNADTQLRSIEKENEEVRQWSEFSERQRQIRNQNTNDISSRGYNGKL